MEALSHWLVEHNIYLTFFSFAYLLASIFNFLMGAFLISIKQKSKSTAHLGVLFIWLSVFNAAYIFAHGYYHPLGAYHRWFTVGLILLPIAHMVQWTFKFPTIRNLLVSRIFFTLQYLVSFLFLFYFVSLSLDVGVKFLFTGHHWDFRADEFSALFGKIILLYILMFIASAIWRTIVEGKKDRISIILISSGFVIISIFPAVLNVMSRNGQIPRSTFIITYVLLGVVGYFMILIFYLNRTQDQTTFMVKIVGISLVTFLLMLQFLSMGTLNERDAEYNELHKEYAERAIEGGNRHTDIEYIVSYEPGAGFQKLFERDKTLVNFNLLNQEWQNTIYYEKLKKIEEPDFREKSVPWLKANIDPYFSGYRDSLIHYISNSKAGPEDLKEETLSYIASLNTTARVARNKILKMNLEKHPKALEQYLEQKKEKLGFFAKAIQSQMSLLQTNNLEAKRKIALRVLEPLDPEHTRHYRRTPQEAAENYKHYTAFSFYHPESNKVYEVGFSYRLYREYIHHVAFRQVVILFVVLLVLLLLFPLFFKGSLLNPLNALVRGIRKVNKGDLSVEVPILVQDEIGFLSNSFNKMVKSIADAQAQLQDYAHNLEEKVKVRTAELNETLENVKKLKTQQDGDYFLTALLQKPLNYNANKSQLVKIEFYMEQKKKFDFRNKHSELGGDLCVSGNLRIGTPNDYRRYAVSLNADAMGKSMQGAGGALVLGVVMNSIMSRSAKGDRILDTTPEQWLTDVYEEIHGVFLAFNGSMVISCVLNIIDEQSGDMWYFNAEHPFQVLYRNKAASFIEEELLLRKVGLESEIPFKVYYAKLQPGDVVIMGSDGRDDINMTPDEDIRDINDDEFLFLKRVEEADGQLEGIVEGLKNFGELTDDLSLLRIGFQESTVALEDTKEAPKAERKVIDIDLEEEGAPKTEKSVQDFQSLFDEGRELARTGNHTEALRLLSQAYEINSQNQALKKMMGVLSFKEKEYDKAIQILEDYLSEDSELEDFWLYLSIAHKHAGAPDKALDAAQKVYDMNPERVINLVNMADLYHRRGNKGLAREFVEKALQLDPQNRQAKTIQSLVQA